MSYKILPTREFEKDFKKCEKKDQERIKKKIEEVAEKGLQVGENRWLELIKMASINS